MTTIEVRICGKRRYWKENGRYIWDRCRYLNEMDILAESFAKRIQEELDKDILDVLDAISQITQG